MNCDIIIEIGFLILFRKNGWRMDKNKILEEYFDLVKFFQDTVYDDYISNKSQKLKILKIK